MIAHFDIDAFYASVAVREDPSLRGRPVAIAGSSRRAVVLTASYEARPFGVGSAMPLYRARELCPQLVVVAPNMGLYKAISREVFSVLGARGHPLERLSLDEAFVEMGEMQPVQAQALAATIRREVFAATRLTVSAGVAGAKMVAKVASDCCKPDGLLVVAPGEEAAFLAPLSAGRLWGVGPKTLARLAARGISTIGEIAKLDAASLRMLFGSWGQTAGELANGIDRRQVEPVREVKSISTEETFEYDVSDETQLREVLAEQARQLCETLLRDDVVGSSVGVKIKRADRTVTSRQTRLSEPTRHWRTVYHAALWCLRRARTPELPVRLLGTRVAELTPGDIRQGSLF